MQMEMVYNFLELTGNERQRVTLILIKTLFADRGVNPVSSVFSMFS